MQNILLIIGEAVIVFLMFKLIGLLKILVQDAADRGEFLKATRFLKKLIDNDDA